jgi:uncharacterized protein (UPF0548 family)
MSRPAPTPRPAGQAKTFDSTRLAKIAGPLGSAAQRQITARYLRSLAR